MAAERETGSRRIESEGDKRLRMNQHEREHPWSRRGFAKTRRPKEDD